MNEAEQHLFELAKYQGQVEQYERIMAVLDAELKSCKIKGLTISWGAMVDAIEKVKETKP